MTTGITDEIKEELKKRGYALTGDIGGQPKNTYWTPDGRQLRTQPSWREYAKRDASGKVIESGVRDANLDFGWLLQKPLVLKPYCPHCDKWHDKPKEIEACGQKRQILDSKWQKKAKAMLHKQTGETDTSRMEKLESEMGEIKGMLQKLLEKK